jgi:uncharacterized protein
VNPNNTSPFTSDLAATVPAQQPKAFGDANVRLFNRTRDSLLAANVAVANSYFPRLVGLLGKGSGWAQEERGLWIIPSHGVHTLAMRFAIDVVFLDRRRVVVHLHQNLRPWRISKVIASARSVLELPVGRIAKSQTEVGDQIEIR